MCESCYFCDSPQGSPGWRADRLGKITGTRIPSIRGFNPYMMDMEALAREIYDPTCEPIAVNDAMRMGTKLEPYVREVISTTLGGVEIMQPGLAVWKQNNLIAASVDGLFRLGDDLCLLEIKTTQNKNIIFSAQGTRPIYRPHLEQMNYTAGIVGAKKIYYAVYNRGAHTLEEENPTIDNRMLFCRTIDFDPTLFEEQVHDAVEFDKKYRERFSK